MTVVRPPSGWKPVDLGELWRFRDLVWMLGIRDFKLRYRQTAVGVAWVILQPLIAAAIFAVVFGRVAKLNSAGVPYFLFSYIGMTAWSVFSSALTRMSTSLVSNPQLVTKVYIPRATLPIATVWSVVVDFVVMMSLAFVFIWFGHNELGVRAIWSPFLMIGFLLLAIGPGLAAAATSVRYRDLQYVVPVVVQTLLFATPVGYATANVPSSLRPYFDLNPLTGLLEAFRWSLLGTAPPSSRQIIASIVGVVLSVGLGLALFGRQERRFADAI